MREAEGHKPLPAGGDSAQQQVFLGRSTLTWLVFTALLSATTEQQAAAYLHLTEETGLSKSVTQGLGQAVTRSLSLHDFTPTLFLGSKDKGCLADGRG